MVDVLEVFLPVCNEHTVVAIMTSWHDSRTVSTPILPGDIALGESSTWQCWNVLVYSCDKFILTQLQKWDINNLCSKIFAKKCDSIAQIVCMRVFTVPIPQGMFKLKRNNQPFSGLSYSNTHLLLILALNPKNELECRFTLHPASLQPPVLLACSFSACSFWRRAALSECCSQ